MFEQWRTRGRGEAEPPALPTRDHSEGAGLLILHLPQAIYIEHSTLQIALHSPKLKIIRKKIKIYPDSQQSFD